MTSVRLQNIGLFQFVHELRCETFKRCCISGNDTVQWLSRQKQAAWYCSRIWRPAFY